MIYREVPDSVIRRMSIEDLASIKDLPGWEPQPGKSYEADLRRFVYVEGVIYLMRVPDPE